ncbi:ribonuclease J [Candidatus Dojkabacteria bacterium]|uniref:Ribonuclease J n=1 Tax=Candidatus Dojkabacteria bacterium TaxID=2099670 RepID=A0A3M0YXY9_9BACT|nr:MAG: ribonuclease J [Candidatus Dojkabacteria bacterium]
MGRTLSKNKELVRIVPLGGVEEIGINCTVYETKDDLILVDLGLGFSEFDYYGIDYVVPDLSYVIRKVDKLRGIIFTHGHLDHIGGLQYFLEKLNFPKVYGSEFTLELIKVKLEDEHLLGPMLEKFTVVDENSSLVLGDFKVEFFRVNHSIPQSLGLYIRTDSTSIVHTGDFKFDNSPVNEPVGDYAKLAKIGEEGVDILLSDSTNSLKKGHPISESDVARGIEDVVERARGRVIIATFAGLVGRLYQIFETARKYHRKVAVAGYSMYQTLGIAQKIGYIKIQSDMIISIQDVKKYSPSKILVLTTGAQGEPEAGLSKMAFSDYKGFSISKNDTVIISAKTIAGNDRSVQLMIDKLMSLGAIVKQSEDLDLYTSGHGYQEDQKIMINLVKPKYFMPIHGYQYFLRAHGETAKSVGIPEGKIIIAKKGSVVEGNRYKGFRISKVFNCEPLMVSGSGVGDVLAPVLKEREQLASYGVVVVDLVINKERELLKDPFVFSKGFVFVKNNTSIIDTAQQIVQKTFIEKAKTIKDINELREVISQELAKYLYQETEREPVIITIINFI